MEEEGGGCLAVLPVCVVLVEGDVVVVVLGAVAPAGGGGAPAPKPPNMLWKEGRSWRSGQICAV